LAWCSLLVHHHPLAYQQSLKAGRPWTNTSNQSNRENETDREICIATTSRVTI
jgi:hypothetical protein